MVQDSAINMPAYPGLAEPFSVLAARAVRAGQIRRVSGLTRPTANGERQKAAVFISGNSLEQGVPTSRLDPPELASFYQHWWPVVRKHTDTDRFRVESLLAALWQVRELDGDIIECGSYRGGLGFLMAFAVREWGLRKKVHLYDSFEGLPPLAPQDEAESQETYFFEGQFQEGGLIEHARGFLAEHGLSDIVEFHKGWFEQTLPEIPAEQRFCFAHIDCDLYTSAWTCWQHAIPHMVSGGAVVVDDYESYGMYKAIWEYLSGASPSDEATSLPAPAATTVTSSYRLYTGALKQAHFYITPPAIYPVGTEDWSPLLSNRPYCAYLAALCADMIVVCSGPPRTPRDEQLIDSLDRLLGPERKVPFLERFIAFLYHQA